jgi:hypothetical protein
MTRQESGKLKDRQPAVWQEALIAEPALQAVLRSQIALIAYP